MERESMVFYRSFYEAIKSLPPEEFKKCAVALLEYGLNGTGPETEGIEKTVYIMAKPQIDKNNQRYFNGKNGGRPNENQSNTNENECRPDENQPNTSQNETTQNQTITKTKPKHNQTITEQEPDTQNAEPNVNDNVNVNANVNDNTNDNAKGNKKEKSAKRSKRKTGADAPVCVFFPP